MRVRHANQHFPTTSPYMGMETQNHVRSAQNTLPKMLSNYFPFYGSNLPSAEAPKCEGQIITEKKVWITPNNFIAVSGLAPFNKKDFPTSFDWNGNIYQLYSLVAAPEPPRCIRDRVNGTPRTIIPSSFNQ